MKFGKLNESGNYSISLPCTIGTKVYVIAMCKDIPAQLDGNYDTATWYCCPYENDCPYAFEECDESNETLAVFEDTVCSIIIDEVSVRVTTESINGMRTIGDEVFCTREEAENRLANING